MTSFRLLLLAALAGALLPVSARGDLSVTGVDGQLERNVLAFVGLANEDCDAEAWLVRRRYRNLEKQARDALEPFGFYDPVITSTLTFDDECWNATLDIDPGDPVRYRKLDIRIAGEAAQDAPFTDASFTDTLRVGQPLRHADYSALKRRLQTLAADRGYVEAEFLASTLDVWPDEHAADVTLHFDSGPRYRIGTISIEQSFLDPNIALGYMALQSGAPFDATDLARAHRDLTQSAYFSNIRVTPEYDRAENLEIPIRVTLEPGTRIEYTVGAGVSTDTGVRFRAGFRNNRINRRGHRLISDLNASQVLQGISAEYRIPLADPRHEWLSFAVAGSREENDTFINEAQRLGVRWTKIMGPRWLRTLSLDIVNESFDVGTDIATSRLVVPGVVYDQKIADRDVFPSRGRRIVIGLGGTDDALGSTTSFLQSTFWARWVRSIGEDTRLLTRIDAGVTASKDFNRLPPSVRFFAGGDESVRGYDYDSLGPTDAEGNVIGGDNLLTASLEYERRLRGNFYGAVFVDAGNAFNNTDFDPEVGAGLGIKWRSPLGLIRLYAGYPVTADEQSVRFHLRLGADL